MKRRRSTVYVRPGKDVTLYVPSETPSEVIDYLNELKRDGYFSQGVMEIVTDYVLRGKTKRYSPKLTEEASRTYMDEQDLKVTVPRFREDAEELLTMQEMVHEPKEIQWSLSQIFDQAKRNAGKISGQDET